MKKRTIAAAASVALMVAAAFTPAANAANGVQPNKDSITAWVDQTSIAGMNTRQTAFDGSVITCKIATSQASDCLSVSPGSPDSQTVTNAAATRKWFRDLPEVSPTQNTSGNSWKSNKFAADMNPVTNIDRFYSYNPYTPWTAGAGLGVKWDMKATDKGIIINSSIKNFGDDEAPRTTVTISTNGKKFALTGKNLEGGVIVNTSGTIKTGITVVTPPK